MPKGRDRSTREICERIQQGFGRRLKSLRESRDMGQKALAPKLQLSRTSVSNLECGVHLPTLSDVYRAAHLFGVTVEQLLPPVEDVFPLVSISSATDDPVSDQSYERLSELIRDVSSGQRVRRDRATKSSTRVGKPRKSALSGRSKSR